MMMIILVGSVGSVGGHTKNKRERERERERELLLLLHTIAGTVCCSF
jgi:hypothetical protein